MKFIAAVLTSLFLFMTPAFADSKVCEQKAIDFILQDAKTYKELKIEIAEPRGIHGEEAYKLVKRISDILKIPDTARPKNEDYDGAVILESKTGRTAVILVKGDCFVIAAHLRPEIWSQVVGKDA